MVIGFGVVDAACGAAMENRLVQLVALQWRIVFRASIALGFLSFSYSSGGIQGQKRTLRFFRRFRHLRLWLNFNLDLHSLHNLGFVRGLPSIFHTWKVAPGQFVVLRCRIVGAACGASMANRLPSVNCPWIPFNLLLIRWNPRTKTHASLLQTISPSPLVAALQY
ncbi:hypothetical protein M3231_06510 [Neobacillus mesonae]|nr:hypothetical protein [Neobacillus mesonae]